MGTHNIAKKHFHLWLAFSVSGFQIMYLNKAPTPTMQLKTKSSFHSTHSMLIFVVGRECLIEVLFLSKTKLRSIGVKCSTIEEE